MLKTSSISIAINVNNEFDRVDYGKNKTKILSISFTLKKKSIEVGYPNFKSAQKDDLNAKKSGSNTKKGVEVVRGSNYLTSDAEKAFI